MQSWENMDDELNKLEKCPFLSVKWLSLLLMLASVWSSICTYCFVSVRARCPPQGLEPYHKSGSFLSTENYLLRLVSCLPAFFFFFCIFLIMLNTSINYHINFQNNSVGGMSEGLRHGGKKGGLWSNVLHFYLLFNMFKEYMFRYVCA